MLAREPFALDSPFSSRAKSIKGAQGMLDGADISKHNSPDSTWVVISGVVYDVTAFLEKHVSLTSHD